MRRSRRTAVVWRSQNACMLRTLTLVLVMATLGCDASGGDGGDGGGGGGAGGGGAGGGGAGGAGGGGGAGSSEFVTVDAANARFMVNGHELYFAGTDAYYLMQERTYGSSTTTDALDAAQAVGMKVVRTWGFADGYAWTNSSDPAILQVTPGVYREQAFAAMDYVIAEAKKRGLYLVIPLVNNWDAYGGMNQYVRWAGLTNHDDFYTDANVKQLYKNYVRDFLNRNNTLTGVPYKSEPAIMAWELVNEMRCAADAGTARATVRTWVEEMATYLKSLDANHLVATGEEGFDNTRTGYSSYSAGWLLDGSQGSSFTDNTQLPVIDFGGLHLYPNPWSISNTDALNWVSDHTSIAHAMGKPMMVGEFGADDHSVYAGWLDNVASSGTAGSLLWEFVPQSRGANESTDVLYPTDTVLVTVFRDHAALMNAK
jgi:mannan endo-1,4-beta-mannosidase